MFCPKGGNTPDSIDVSTNSEQRVNSNPMVSEQCVEEIQETKAQDLNVEYYFKKYWPNRTEAIKAIRRETGMGLIEAKKVIDSTFDELSGLSNHQDISVAWTNLKGAVKKGCHKSKCDGEVPDNLIQCTSENGIGREPDGANESNVNIVATCALVQPSERIQMDHSIGPSEKKQAEGSSEWGNLDLSCYYQKYRHDRVKAIMALRVDT